MKRPRPLDLDVFHAAQAAALAGDLATATRILTENGVHVDGSTTKHLQAQLYGAAYGQVTRDHQKVVALAAAQAAILGGSVGTAARILRENSLGRRCVFCLCRPLAQQRLVVAVVRGVQVHAHALCLAAVTQLHRIRREKNGSWSPIAWPEL